MGGSVGHARVEGGRMAADVASDDLLSAAVEKRGGLPAGTQGRRESRIDEQDLTGLSDEKLRYVRTFASL